MNALKANATRMLREADEWRRSDSPWADGGSKRYLWTDAIVFKRQSIMWNLIRVTCFQVSTTSISFTRLLPQAVLYRHQKLPEKSFFKTGGLGCVLLRAEAFAPGWNT